MSWYVNGRSYNNSKEYQRARKKAEKEKRRLEKARIKKEINRLTNKNYQLMKQMHDISGDVESSQCLLRQVQLNHDDFHRYKQAIQKKQKAFTENMDRKFHDDVRHMDRKIEKVDQQIQNCHSRLSNTTREMAGAIQSEIDTASSERAQLVHQKDQLKEMFNQNKTEVIQLFETLEHEMDQQIKTFSAELIQSAERVAEQRFKVEEDMNSMYAQELAKLNNDHDRAEIILSKVNEILNKCNDHIESHELKSYQTSVLEKLSLVRTENNPSNQLVFAQDAFVEAKTMEKVQQERDIKMKSSCDNLIADIDSLAQMLPDTRIEKEFQALQENPIQFQTMRREGKLSLPLIQYLYCRDQYQHVRTTIEDIRHDVEQEKHHPAWFNFESRFEDRKQTIHQFMEDIASAMDLAEFHEKQHRESRLPAIQAIRKRMKTIMGAKPNFNAIIDLDNASEASPKVLHMEWGEIKYDAYVTIEGQVIDEMQYGFQSNESCGQKAREIRQAITDQPRSVIVDHDNPRVSDPGVLSKVDQLQNTMKKRKANA